MFKYLSNYRSRFSSGGRLLAVAAWLAAGYLAGVTSSAALVQADVRRGETEQQHFRSGAQRSEVLLGEISVTLAKMDARLERMEKLAAQLAHPNGQPLPGEARLP